MIRSDLDALYTDTGVPMIGGAGPATMPGGVVAQPRGVMVRVVNLTSLTIATGARLAILGTRPVGVASKCEGKTTGPLTLHCEDTSQCKGNGGDGSEITCDAMSNCDFKAGADTIATCSDTAVCKLNLGAHSTVSCQDESACNIKCDVDCAVTCAATAECAVTCGAVDAAATVCGDGHLVCGSC